MTSWVTENFSPLEPHEMPSPQAGRHVPLLLPLLLFGLFVLSVAIFLLPSLAHTPSLPSGKAPIEVLVEGFRSPTGVTVGPDGTLFFTDEKEGALFQQDPDGNLVLLEDDLKKPRGLTRAEDGTLFFVAERLRGDRGDSHERGLLLERSPDGTLSTVASGFKKPQQLAMAEDGSLLLSTWRGRREPHSEDNGEKEEEGEDQDAEEDKAEEDVEQSEWHVGLPGTIFRVGPDGTIFEAHPGFLFPSGLTLTQDTTLAVAARAFKRRDGPLLIGSLFRLSSNGEVTVLLQERFLRPKGIMQDALGKFYVAVKRGLWGHLFRRRHDRNGLRGGLILKVAPDGTFTTFAHGFRQPWGLALDADGNLYVSDPKAGRIVRFIAPPPPTLADHAATTSEQTITIEGTSEPEAQITAKGGQEDASTLADAEGKFELDVLLTSDQLNELKVYATAAGGEGLTGSPATATVVQDSTPPVVAFLRPSPDSQLAGITTVEITAEDTGSGIATVEFLVDGATQGTRSEPPFTFSLDPAQFAPGRHTLTASAADQAGNVATAEIQVDFGLLPPTLGQFEPTSGKVGSPVTLTGTNFDLNPSGNTVTFNGVPAQVLGASSTQLITEVPAGATTGSIAVRTAGGTATSTGHFIVLPTEDFQISALPTALNIPSAGQAAFNVSVTGSEGFTGLTTLGVSGVPTGTTATFAAATLTVGQTTLLTVQTTGTTPAGSQALNVTATGLLNGVQTVRSATATLQVQGAGQTSLLGQVLDEDGKPVKGAVAQLGTLQATTDDGGNFLIANPPVGPDQLLFIDGGPASTPGRNLPIVPYKVTIVAGQANTLGFVPHLHFQKTTGLVNISNTGVERVVTDPDVPGFEMRIPAGVTITGWDGQPNTQVSIRRVPVDRLPLPPFPDGFVSPIAYMYYFGKQGGGTPSTPIPITTPNDLNLPPGTQVELWFYDEAPDGSRPNQWAQYGTGTVSADGSQIIPDIDPATGQQFGQPRFCCGGMRTALRRAIQVVINATRGGIAEAAEPTPGGEPVNLSTGTFTLQKADMVLPGRIPIAFTRMYRTNGASGGPFGSGTSHPYHVLLLIENDLRTLLLPSGARLAFPRQPNATFQNSTDPSVRGAVLTETGSNHTLRFKDGTTWTFGTPIANTAFLTSQIDRNGNTVTLTRSGFAQNLTAITEPSGRSVTLSVDGNDRITAITDPIGRTVAYSYDGAGRLETVTDPAGGVTTYTYDADGRMLTITDPRGITFITNEYDAEGRVIRQTQADGGVWNFAYTVTGGVITETVVTDPRGNPTTHRFNGQGYLIEQTDALGQTTTQTRDPATNLLLSTTDPLGRVTSFTYDTQGNVTSITDPADNVRSLEYEPTFNKLTKITDRLGNVTQFAYDVNGNLTTITDPLGNLTQIAYNTFGQPISTTDPLGNVTTFTYDTVGNLTEIADPLGNTTTRTYDLVSRLIEQTDPRGKTTEFFYDELNRITQIVDALNRVTSFAYDGNGNLLTVTDARGSVTIHTYDVMDRLETRTDPLNRSESFNYDPNGNLIQSTDRKVQISTFTYDALNRQTRSDFADATFAEFTFDAAGRPIRASDSQTGTIVEEFDVLDRLIRETTPQGTISYGYDPLGRRTTMTVDGQSPVTYTYDAASRLRTITQSSVPSPVTIDYDAFGRRTLLTLPNGVSTEYQYDAASRLTALIYRNAVGVLGDLNYQYDPAGNRIAVGGSFARTLLPDPAVSATYDAANQQLTFGDKTMTFDANGNLETITDPTGTTTFTWDARNRLVSISGPTVTASFQYGALGRRIQKVINGQPAQYQYDGKNIIQEQLNGVLVTYLRSLRIDESFIRGEQEFYLTDGLGSTLGLTDATGAVGTTYTYEPFGRTLASGLLSSNPFQYTGRENDGTGAYHYRARQYHPGLARFMSMDRVQLSQFSRVQNRYLYALANPLRYIDPLGDVPTWVDVGGVIIVAGAAFTVAGYPQVGIPLIVGGAAYIIWEWVTVVDEGFDIGRDIWKKQIMDEIERTGMSAKELQEIGTIPSNERLRELGVDEEVLIELGLLLPKK